MDSVLAKKGLAIANYVKEIANENTGEISFYHFVGKPLARVAWGKAE